MVTYAHREEIRSVHHLLERLRVSDIASKRHAHARLWFRGHADESWNLVPGVYRTDFPEKTEKERLTLERHLTQDFRAMSAGIRRGDEGEAELYFIQQHYRMRTRLLDWSTNALAGLYFAVSEHPETNGALFFMDAYQLGPTQNAEFKRFHDGKTESFPFEGIADSRHPVFQDALHVIFWWQGPECFPEFIFPVRPDYSDRRITLQRGCFTFHVPSRSNLTIAENDTLTAYIIPASAKEPIRQDLALLGIDDFSIYGDLDHLSSRLKAAYGIP